MVPPFQFKFSLGMGLTNKVNTKPAMPIRFCIVGDRYTKPVLITLEIFHLHGCCSFPWERAARRLTKFSRVCI